MRVQTKQRFGRVRAALNMPVIICDRVLAGRNTPQLYAGVIAAIFEERDNPLIAVFGLHPAVHGGTDCDLWAGTFVETFTLDDVEKLQPGQWTFVPKQREDVQNGSEDERIG